MSSVCIVGAEIVTPLEIFKGNVEIEGELISKVSDTAPRKNRLSRVLDGRGCFLTPGLIDLQVNGSKDCNLWAAPTAKQFERLRLKLLEVGVTSFLPTLITDDIARLRRGIDFLAANGVKDSQLELGRRGERGDGAPPLARVPGIHLEGPFLSPEKPGVHPAKYIQPITVAAVKKLLTPQVTLMTLAPELKNAAAAIKLLRKHHVAVSLGHSNATFEQATKAFNSGVTLMTHAFNALPPIHHRAPGAVAAALLNPRAVCMVIADGLHVDPEIIELLLKNKGVGHTVLVSDAASEGTRHGKLVGSSITVTDAVRNMVKWKIASFAEAITMASYNPACAIGLEKKIGVVAPGKKADLLLWDKKSLKIRQVILGGQLV